ncbi:MAG: marine proteobacterial sortase target protein [Gammaproteobacteria bacterium]
MEGHTAEEKPGGLFVATEGAWEPAPTLTADAAIEVTGMIARVDIRQSFTNPSSEWLEGIYVFPLPTDAAVDTLELRVADQWIQGEIRERQQAKEIYRQARDSGRQAGLVNQDRPNLFSMSVANIPPGETVYVRIGYFQKVGYDDEGFRLHFPMTVMPRYLPRPVANEAVTKIEEAAGIGLVTDIHREPVFGAAAQGTGGGHMSLSVQLRAGIAIESIDGGPHELTQALRGDTVSVSPAAGRIRMDRDFIMRWVPERMAVPEAAVYTETFAGEKYVLVMLVPPHNPVSQHVVPREVILVVDTSGSMAGAPLEQALGALSVAIERLKPADKFNLIEFNSETRALYENSVVATQSNKKEAIDWLRDLEAEGGTEMAGALEQALVTTKGDRLRQVVFMTDGSVANEAQLFRLIRGRLGGSRLFTVGIGPAPNRHFMEKAARFGRGTHIQISQPEEVQLKMETLLRKLERPALTDISIEWTGTEPVEVWPQRIADLYAGEPVLIAARTRGAGSWVDLSGASESGYWLRQLELPDGESVSGVATVWAREKLSGLSDRMLEADDPETVRDEMISVALEHGLVSRFTSLVAVDKTPLRPSWEKTTTRSVPAVAPGKYTGVRIGAFPATATQAPMLLMHAFWLLVLASVLLFFRPWNSLAWD